MIPQYTTDEVLALVDQEYLMSFLVTGASTKHNFCSPFRNDKGPGCWLSWHKGLLHYFDPRDTLRNGKTIVGLQKLATPHFSYREVLMELLRLDAKLQRPTRKRAVKKEIAARPVKYQVREWDTWDEDIWSKTGLTIQDLEKGTPKLLPAKWVEVYSRKLEGYVRQYSTEASPMYIYVWPPDLYLDAAIKVYRPKETVPSLKWGGNSTGKHFYYYKGDKQTEMLFIAGSGKDAKVVHKCGAIDTLAANGEMYKDYPWDIISQYKYVIVGLDNDDTGKQYADKLVQEARERGFYSTAILPKLKDWTEDRITLGLPFGESLMFKINDAVELMTEAQIHKDEGILPSN